MWEIRNKDYFLDINITSMEKFIYLEGIEPDVDVFVKECLAFFISKVFDKEIIF